MDPHVLDQEIDTYERNREQLLAKAEDEYVLIKGEHIAGTFESQMDAVREGVRQFGDVPFLVKRIEAVETPVQFTSNFFEV